jgi:hypothetical protein
MHTNLRKRLLPLLVLVLFALGTKAQFMPEQHRAEVYNYLYRMAQKGLVVFEDQIRPVNRLHIESCLDTLASKAHLLTATEKAELRFYQQEYTDQKALQQPKTGIFFLQKDSFNRWRGNTSQNAHSLLRMDPLIAMSLTTGSGRNVLRTATGAKAYGYTGKWGYFIALADVYERGKGIDTLKQFTPETGAIGRISTNKNSFNYPELRAGISYTWKQGSISFLYDHLLWGYGENGRVTFSDKAPAHPQIRLDFRPFSWLRLQHTHGWLNSRLLDSSRSYGTGSGIYAGERQIFINKFFAQHSITFTPMKGLDVSLGESMVYSDQFNPVYLVPVVFFKAYELVSSNENINAGSNGQFFLGISSRNQIKNTHFYATWFIDEIRVNTLFNKNTRRNQSALQLGLSVTDLGLRYLTLGVEYTRIYPFTYRNLIPAQNFTHAGFPMGDWIGNNAERSLIYVKYTPVPRLKCELNVQRIKKGGPGTLDQQYFGVPQPVFLFDKQFERTDFTASLRYEWINSLYLFTSATLSKMAPVNSPSYTDRVIQTGIQFGF